MKEVKKLWGSFKQLTLNKKCTTGFWQALSLQKHKKRSEMWYFLIEDYVQLEGRKRAKSIKKGELVKIRKRQPHRLIAKNKKVQILEISFGKFKKEI